VTPRQPQTRVKLAIGARLSYQFRGGSTGGGISKEYMQELARERNRVVLPKIVPNEWGVRLPSERFVLSGTSWGLKGYVGGGRRRL